MSGFTRKCLLSLLLVLAVTAACLAPAAAHGTTQVICRHGDVTCEAAQGRALLTEDYNDDNDDSMSGGYGGEDASPGGYGGEEVAPAPGEEDAPALDEEDAPDVDEEMPRVRPPRAPRSPRSPDAPRNRADRAPRAVDEARDRADRAPRPMDETRDRADRAPRPMDEDRDRDEEDAAPGPDAAPGAYGEDAAPGAYGEDAAPDASEEAWDAEDKQVADKEEAMTDVEEDSGDGMKTQSANTGIIVGVVGAAVISVVAAAVAYSKRRQAHASMAVEGSEASFSSSV